MKMIIRMTLKNCNNNSMISIRTIKVIKKVEGKDIEEVK